MGTEIWILYNYYGTEIWILYNYYVSWNIIILNFQPFKNAKAMTGLQAVQTRQWARQTLPMGHSSSARLDGEMLVHDEYLGR